MRDKRRRTLKIELLSQWKLEAEFRNYHLSALSLQFTCAIYLPPRLPRLITESPSFTVIIVRRQLSDARDISTGGGCHTWQKRGVIPGRRTPKLPAGCVRCHMHAWSFIVQYTVYTFIVPGN